MSMKSVCSSFHEAMSSMYHDDENNARKWRLNYTAIRYEVFGDT